MDSQPYVIRNYRNRDFSEYVRLHVEAESVDRIGCCTSPQSLDENLRHPHCSPEDDLFVAEIEGGRIAGYVHIKPELNIGRAVLRFLIHPEYRAGDLAARLFNDALRRASSMGAKLAHVNVPEDDTTAGGLLSRLGFVIVRRFLELRLDISEVQTGDIDHAPYCCRHLLPNEEVTLAEIQNRSFAGTWGYNPNTVEEIGYRVDLSNCCREGILLVCEGEKPVGYCWTTVDRSESDVTAESRGRIYMIGVDPGYRGRGIGRCALRAGLTYLTSRGITIAEITVDSENRRARALYDSFGFKIWLATAWYERSLV